MIDRNLKWTQYCEKHNTDTLYFFDKEKNKLITIAEGCGDNLDADDEENGYVDYWYCEVYTDEGNIGGGMMMLETYIVEDDMTIDEIISFQQKNADFYDSVDIDLAACLVDVEEGRNLETHFENICMALIEKKGAEAAHLVLKTT